MSKKSIALGSVFGLAAGIWFAANTVEINSEYEGTVTDRGIHFQTVIGETGNGPTISVNTYLDYLVIDNAKEFHLKKSVSMDNGHDSSFYLRWEHNFEDVPHDDPVNIGDRVRIEYSGTFWQYATNHFQRQSTLKSNFPQRLHANKLEYLAR
jgi:hypothetical protein